MKKTIFLVASAALLLIATSCATIMSGGKTEVTFTSEPKGATVLVDGKVIGETPVNKVISNRSKTTTFTLEGYDLLSYKVPKSTNFWYFANLNWITVGYFTNTTIALSGLAVTGILIDLTTGANIKIPKEIKVEMVKKPPVLTE